MAMTHVCGFAPATYGGATIAETYGSVGKLGPMDMHFGLNGNVAVLGVPEPIAGFGPRAIDMARRGGTVAEMAWLEHHSGKDDEDLSAEYRDFISFATSFGKDRQPGASTFRAGATLIEHGKVISIAGGPKWDADAPNKSMEHAGGGRQLGARWSKVSMEWVVARGGRVHFHFDGMGDIAAILHKTADSTYNVTSRELRYLYRNWGRLRRHAVLYNGYFAMGGSGPISAASLSAAQVSPPWM